MWRIRRRLKTYAAAALLGLAIVAGIGWLLLPALVERRILAELQAAGVAVASLNVTAAGFSEARIGDVRLGVDGQFSAGEVIASYDLAEILGSPLKRVTIRDLRVQGRLDSDGLLFGRLGPGSSSGGPLLPASLVQALPPVEIESGRIELATPIGPAVLPVRGLLLPKADGSLDGTLDVQAESARGAMDGALALTVQERRVDADLTIKSGSITTGAGAPIAFHGGAKLGWEQDGRPQVSATLALPAARVADADFPGATLAIDMTDAQWRGRATMAQEDGASRLDAALTVADPYGKPQLSAAGKVMATSGAWIWPVLGLPRPQEGSAQLELQLEGPLPGGIAGTPERFEGRLKTSAHLSGWAIGGYGADAIDLDVDPSISWADGRLSLNLLQDGAATARQVAGGVLAGKLDEVTLPLLKGDAPLLAIDLNEQAGPSVAFDLRLGAVKATAPLLVGTPKPLRVALAMKELRWAGTWTPAGGPTAVLHLDGGSLSAPSLGVAAGGVSAEVAFDGDKASADLAGSITNTGKPPLHVPLSLTGKAEADGDRLTFTGVLRDKSKRFRSTIDMDYAFAADEGQATLKMAPVTFDPAGLQPQDLVPAIGSQVEEVTGESALAGTVRWKQGKLTSDLELLLKDLSFQSPQANILKLNSVVKIDSLLPFTTKRKQQLAAGLVDVGLPLNDLVADFHVERGFRLVIESARLALAGGAVSMPKVAFNLTDPQAELALTVTDVDLGKLLQLAQVEGLDGTGSLAGRIPVTIAGRSIAISEATLAAGGPGTLRYVPTQSATALLGSSESVDMALQALSNFQYNELTLTLSREPGGDTVALLHVKGQNPNFYGGYPVELNLNVSGKLDQILDRSLQGYRIPETIRERLGDFGE